MELPYDPEIPFLGMQPKELKSGTQICTHIFIETLFKTVKRWTQPKYSSIDECKQNVVCTQWNIIQS